MIGKHLTIIHVFLFKMVVYKIVLYRLKVLALALKNSKRSLGACHKGCLARGFLEHWGHRYTGWRNKRFLRNVNIIFFKLKFAPYLPYTMTKKWCRIFWKILWTFGFMQLFARKNAKNYNFFAIIFTVRRGVWSPSF